MRNARTQQYLQVAQTWEKTTDENQYLIHGHRNTNEDEIQIADRVFNLEGRVEFGGHLRIVELDENGFHPIEIQSCQPITQGQNTEKRKVISVEECIKLLRNNKFVQEKQLGDNISSFNFTREAFYSANWNEQTILARGLFLNTNLNKIVARSYEKFFRINERPETQIAMLGMKFQFPVNAFLKENGFLGIISYNQEKDELFIASKSSNKSEFAGYVKQILEEKYDAELLKETLKNKYPNYTFVFECIDPVNDPHIIEYPKQKLVLLDVIKNSLEFEYLEYSELQKISEEIKIPCKKLIKTFNNWNEFIKFYSEATSQNYKLDGQYVEGFVFADSARFMTKLKCNFYNEWKFLRSVAETTLKSGFYYKTSGLITPTQNMFYGFCKELYNQKYEEKRDIISLRKLFFTKYPNFNL